jgi:hypothetical protein
MSPSPSSWLLDVDGAVGAREPSERALDRAQERAVGLRGRRHRVVVAKYSFPAQFRVGVGGRSADARRMTDATKVRVEGPSDEGAGGLGRPRATAVLGQSRSAQVQSHDALTLRMFSEIRAGRSSTDGGSSPKRGGHFGELG